MGGRRRARATMPPANAATRARTKVMSRMVSPCIAPPGVVIGRRTARGGPQLRRRPAPATMRYFGYMLPTANWFRPPGMEIAQDFEGIGEMRRRPEPAAALGTAAPRGCRRGSEDARARRAVGAGSGRRRGGRAAEPRAGCGATASDSVKQRRAWTRMFRWGRLSVKQRRPCTQTFRCGGMVKQWCPRTQMFRRGPLPAKQR